MKVTYAVVAVFLLAAVATGLFLRSRDADYHHKSPRDTTDLADRINHACKPGYELVNWTTGDEWNPLPPGVIQVTCGKTGEDFDTYTVAVAR